jgi:capsular polysaccharide transport system permease protein
MMPAFARRHGRIVGALLMREMTTRFGRQGIGFAWVVGEPMLFCFGVLIMWSLTKPAYEHGIKLAPFVVTGYMCLILIRHLISLLSSAIQANIGLLYHRQVSPLHILAARVLLEVGGATVAFIVVYIVLLFLGQVSPPHDYLLIYGGWFVVAWGATGLALLMTGLVMRFEVFERVVNLISYVMIPVSGAFFMAAWLPEAFRRVVMILPFVHGVEMVRAGVFGEFVETHFDLPYALAIGTILNIIGLLLLASSMDRIEVD